MSASRARQGEPSSIDQGSARDIYRALMKEPLSPDVRTASRAFLTEQLANAARLPAEMPFNPDAITQWMEQGATRTAEQYADYLQLRKKGEGRLYFSNRSHALSFLQRIAPTKLVDGAWLYGFLQHWPDDRFYPLIRTYLEELGDGDPAQNHVVLYQRLLARYGCEPLPELSDAHYAQGALQLALGYNAEHFIPEIIGYNLGYEQLPLHLLISAFELDELGIDPYYFTLHVTVDNASTGHARKAVQMLLNVLPTDGSRRRFMDRVVNGFRLNDLGIGATDVVESFDLEQELLEMLSRKRAFGQHVHSDYCVIGGRTVNEWLADADKVPEFLQAMITHGWIKRDQDPANSRFWQVIDGNIAPMFGVFSLYEKQLIHDWIAGSWLNQGVAVHGPGELPGSKPLHPKKTVRRRAAPGSAQRLPLASVDVRSADLDGDEGSLEREIAALPDELRMNRLIGLLAPDKHATGAGLLAARLFSAGLG